MKKRYITFYQLDFPKVRSYGMLLTDNWGNCLFQGLKQLIQGKIIFFHFERVRHKHNLPYRG